MFKRRSLAAAGVALPLGATAGLAQTAPVPTPASIVAVQSIRDLKTIETRPTIVLVVGYHHDGDRGGGTFRWAPNDTTAADDALTVAPGSDPRGRFRRVIAGPIDVSWFGARGDGIADDTTPLQAALDHCATQEPAAPALYLPAGKYRITAPLRIPQRFVQIFGDGMWRSQITFSGVTGGGLIADRMRYLNPVLRDFALLGDATSGKGLDFSRVYEDVYLGEIKNIRIEAGDDAFFSPSLFSMVIENVVASSHKGHSFRASCGPSVAWRNCYAMVAGPGKAGYRLAGAVALYSCNGVNEANYWGVFGCDRTATDGFQNDFPEAELTHVTMVECNVEDFGTGPRGEFASGILLHNAYRQFHMIGGKFVRTLVSTPYHSVIRSRIGPSSPGGMIRLSPGLVELGSGTCTAAPLISDGQSFFTDENGAFSAKNIKTWREGAKDFRLILTTAVTDATIGESAINFSGMSADRMLVNGLTLNISSPAAGSGVIMSNGRAVVATANSAPTVVSAIENGASSAANQAKLLIVQVGDDNTTFRHSPLGIEGLHLKHGIDYRARKGDVLVFVNSNSRDGTFPGWTQL
jgi:hypothetical protein